VTTDIPPFDPEAAKPGFDFARELADPGFRARLKAAGHDGDLVIAMRPTDTLATVGVRLDSPGYEPGRRLLAWPDDAAPQGWRLAWIEVIP
jgi:hypothetical protein